MKKSGYLVSGILVTFGTILQLYGTIRYYDRLPDDMIGISIYSMTTILFAIVAFGFFITWINEKKRKE